LPARRQTSARPYDDLMAAYDDVTCRQKQTARPIVLSEQRVAASAQPRRCSSTICAWSSTLSRGTTWAILRPCARAAYWGLSAATAETTVFRRGCIHDLQFATPGRANRSK